MTHLIKQLVLDTTGCVTMCSFFIVTYGKERVVLKAWPYNDL